MDTDPRDTNMDPRDMKPTQPTQPKGIDPKTGKPLRAGRDTGPEAQHLGSAVAPGGEHAAAEGLSAASLWRSRIARTPQDAAATESHPRHIVPPDLRHMRATAGISMVLPASSSLTVRSCTLDAGPMAGVEPCGCSLLAHRPGWLVRDQDTDLRLSRCSTPRDRDMADLDLASLDGDDTSSRFVALVKEVEPTVDPFVAPLPSCDERR